MQKADIIPNGGRGVLLIILSLQLPIMSTYDLSSNDYLSIFSNQTVIFMIHVDQQLRSTIVIQVRLKGPV